MKKIVSFLLIFTGVSMAQTSGKMKFSAKIENRNSDTLFIYGPKKFKQIIPVNKKGLFESNFDVEEGLYQLNDGKEATLLFLKGGFDLKLDLNTKDFDETIVYKGKGANENNFLAKNALIDETFGNELEQLLEKDEPTFNAGIEKKAAEDEARINAEKLDVNFTKAFKEKVKQEKLMLVQYYKQKSASKKLDNSLAPDFNYENHKGGTVKLSDLKQAIGKIK